MDWAKLEGRCLRHRYHHHWLDSGLAESLSAVHSTQLRSFALPNDSFRLGIRFVCRFGALLGLTLPHGARWSLTVFGDGGVEPNIVVVWAKQAPVPGPCQPGRGQLVGMVST